MIKQVLLAFQFLIIVPVPVKGAVTDRDLAMSAVYFPLVGLFQGVVATSAGFLFQGVFSPDVSAGLLLTILCLMSGGFHLDGLSDAFDALAVKSSGNFSEDRDKRLSVMKDSTTGAIGTIAVVIVLLLSALFIRDVLSVKGPFPPLLIITLLPVFTKLAMVAGMIGAKSARPDGLGKIFTENTGAQQLLFSICITLAVVTGSFFVFSRSITASLPYCIAFIISTMGILFGVVFALRRLFTWRFGGLTGDTLGAIHEVAGLSFLLTALLWR